MIDCPRAKTDMTPCIARDGSLALADDHVCVGCGIRPGKALKDLSERYAPAGEGKYRAPEATANRFRDMVAEYVDQK